MKKLSSLLGALALVLVPASGSAAEKVELSKMHLCCGACQKGVEKAVSTVTGAKVAVDRKAGKAVIEADSAATAQKAANAIADAGYYGVSNHASVKIADAAPAAKVQVATVNNVHLCCKGCVKAVERAVSQTPGADRHDAQAKGESFIVKGDFSQADLQKALHAEGLHGKFAK